MAELPSFCPLPEFNIKSENITRLLNKYVARRGAEEGRPLSTSSQHPRLDDVNFVGEIFKKNYYSYSLATLTGQDGTAEKLTPSIHVMSPQSSIHSLNLGIPGDVMPETTPVGAPSPKRKVTVEKIEAPAAQNGVQRRAKVRKLVFLCI